MREMDKGKFERMMKTFMQTYDRTLTAELLGIYWRVLKDIPDEEVDRTVEECLRRCKFFPKPADIWEAFEFGYNPLQTLE